MVTSLATVGMWAAGTLVCFLFLCYLISRFPFVARSFHSGGSLLAGGTRGASAVFAGWARGCLDGVRFLAMPWHKEAWERHTIWSLLGLVLYRTTNLAIFLSVIFGNLPLDIQRSAVIYFLDAQNNTPLLHLPVDVLVGVVWWAVPGVFLLLLIESVGLLPVEYCLLPSKYNVVRVVTALLATAGLAWSLYEGRNMLLYTTCILAHCSGVDPMLAVRTTADFYVPQTVAGLISLPGALLGLLAVLSLLPLTLCIVFVALEHACLLVKGSAEGITTEVIGKLNPSAVSPPAISISMHDSPYDFLETPLTVSALPERTAGTTDPQQQKELPDPMANRQNRINNLYFDGILGMKLTPYMLHDLTQMSTGFTVNTLSQYCRGRPPLKGLGGGGIEDISPTDREIKGIVARHDNNEEQITKHVYQGVLDRMLQAHGGMRGNGNILFFTDLSRLHLLETTVFSAKEQFPGHSITVVSALPDSKAERGEHNELIIPACSRLTKWHHDRKIDAALLLDLLSPAAAGGQPYLFKQVSKLIVALLSAPFHSLNNPSFSEVMQRAGRLSPIIGVTTGTDKIAIAKVPTLYRIARKVKSSSPERGTADFNDAVMKSRTLTRSVLEQDATLASVCGPDLSKSFYLLYIQPFTEPWKRQEYESQMSRFTYEYDNASTVSVCANGATDPSRGEGLYVQVAAVYPLAPELFHQEEQELLSMPEKLPEPPQTNGQVRTFRASKKFAAGGGDQ